MSNEAQGTFDWWPVGPAMLTHLNATVILSKEIEKADIRTDRQSMNAVMIPS
jgi:hypothetical protein